MSSNQKMKSSRSKSEDSRVKIVTTECSGEVKHQNEVGVVYKYNMTFLMIQNVFLFRMPHFLPLNSRNYLCPKIPQNLNQVCKKKVIQINLTYNIEN